MNETEKSDLRDAIDDADDTGLVAGEELITAALLREKLHAALPREHAAHATIDELHAEMESTSPNPRSIERHVGHLRSLPELEAIVASWWENPQTQRFIATLGQIGL
jgi:hypothetical protein